jgi:hypothetical protein
MTPQNIYIIQNACESVSNGIAQNKKCTVILINSE